MRSRLGVRATLTTVCDQPDFVCRGDRQTWLWRATLINWSSPISNRIELMKGTHTMKFKLFKSSCAAGLATLALSIASSAGATVIDFNVLAHDSDFKNYPGGVVDQGYGITNSADSLFSYGKTYIYNADPGGSTLSNEIGHSWNTLQRLDGRAFSFESIDLSDPYGGGIKWDSPWTYTYTFDFRFEDGTERLRYFEVTNDGWLRTYAVDEVNVTSVSWTAGKYGYTQVDNIRVTAVPEPNAYALVVAGLGLLAFSTRRRPGVNPRQAT